MFGFDPIGSMLGLLFIVIAVFAALLGLTTGGLNLLVAWRHHRPRPA